MAADAEKNSLTDDLKRLQHIADWFDTREQVDIEAALEKVKEAATLLKAAKSRLKDIENEFEEVKKELEAEPSDG
jgi:exonuclease VII small subunit